jgi:hypothetical protein
VSSSNRPEDTKTTGEHKQRKTRGNSSSTQLRMLLNLTSTRGVPKICSSIYTTTLQKAIVPSASSALSISQKADSPQVTLLYATEVFMRNLK